MTQGGTEDASWNFPSQGPDGKTVVSHRDTFEGGSKRPVLYRYGADGKLDIANVMPVYAGATIPVYPITLDMDWKSNAVAYGYSYCGFACNSVYRGYWLTFSDQQGAFPSDPQGQSDAYNPTFYGTRVVSSDSGGNIFVQPDVAEAPFTSSYQGWIGHADGYYLSRAEVSPAQNMVAIEWSRSSDNAEGIVIARHQGTVPSDIADACDVPTVGASSNLTFSPDGTQMAWQDGEGVKVSGVPSLAAGTATCTLTAPPRVISATGRTPHFGGADVGAMIGSAAAAPRRPRLRPGAGGGRGRRGRRRQGREAPGPLPAQGHARRVRQGPDHQGRRRARAGRIDASAGVPAKVARRLRLKAGASAARIASRGVASAATVVVARGHSTAKRAGQTAVLRLRPTKAAKRARQAAAQGHADDQGQLRPARPARPRSSSASREQPGEHPAQLGDVRVVEQPAEALLEGGGEDRAHARERRRPFARQLGAHDAAVVRRHPPRDPAALLEPVDQARGAAAADEQRVGELVHRQPPARGDHEPVHGLVLEQRRAAPPPRGAGSARRAAGCRRGAGPTTRPAGRCPAGSGGSLPSP